MENILLWNGRFQEGSSLCTGEALEGEEGQKPAAAPALGRALLGVPASSRLLPKFRVFGADFTRHPEPACFASSFCVISV